MLYHPHWLMSLSFSGALSLMYCSTVAAHSTPAELAELSLEELYQYTIISDDAQDITQRNRWSLTYTYSRKKIDGYRDGSNNVSLNDVLFAPGETRTSKNYPVVPTTIIQQAHVFKIGYAYSEKTSFHFSLPYIKQSTDHISSVANYDNFVISSDGIGDLNLGINHQLIKHTNYSVSLLSSLSLPTGSIDEKGDTPRAAGNQQLPYTMQLGTGTYDFSFALIYKRHIKNPWSAQLFAKIRTGKNDRDYSLGNRYSLSVNKKFNFSKVAQPYLGAEYSYTDSIHGIDQEITVPNPQFPFPASITNPDNYGGQSLNAKIGLLIPIGISNTSSTLSLEVGYPLYQHLHGIQPSEQASLNVKFNISL